VLAAAEALFTPAERAAMAAPGYAAQMKAERALLLKRELAAAADVKARALAARGGATAAELADIVAGGAGEQALGAALGAAIEDFGMNFMTQIPMKTWHDLTGKWFQLPASQGRELNEGDEV